MLEFEYVADGVILLKENGRVVEEEVLDHKAYEIYASVKEPGTFLIPGPYYRFLKNTKTMTDIEFKRDEWETKILPKIGTHMDKIYYPFQRETIYRMVMTGRCLNACSPGLGKSIQALSALAYYHIKDVTNDLILCPSYLRNNWLEEIKKWFHPLETSTTIIWKAGKNELEGVLKTLFRTPGIKVVSYDMFANISKKYKGPTKFDTIVMDESHLLKNGMSMRYKNSAPIIKKARQVFLLTGTPSPNRSNELFTQFSIIKPSVFFDYKVFANRYCDGKYDKYNRYDDRGASNTKELSHLMSKLSMRLRREDHLSELPNVLRQKVVITPKTNSKKYFKIKKDFMELLNKMDDSEDAKFKVQAMASEMFRETAIIKIEPVLEYLETYIRDDELEQTILFCKHQIMQQAVTSFLNEKGHSFIEISGQTPMADRDGLIKQFTTDKSCTFAVLTTGSCNAGLNIVPIRKMIFLEFEWSPVILDQAEARINRIGGASHLHYIYLVCTNSLDDMVFNKLTRKTTLISDVVDGGKRYGDFEFENNKKQKI